MIVRYFEAELDEILEGIISYLWENLVNKTTGAMHQLSDAQL